MPCDDVVVLVNQAGVDEAKLPDGRSKLKDLFFAVRPGICSCGHTYGSRFFGAGVRSDADGDKTAAERHQNAPVSDEAPSDDKDTATAKKRVECKETANAAVESAKDYSAGFFGEAEQ